MMLTAPSFAAAMDSIPVPHPQSSMRPFSRSCLCFISSAITILVVWCVPVPNACFASMPIVITPGASSCASSSVPVCRASYITILPFMLIGSNPESSQAEFQSASSMSFSVYDMLIPLSGNDFISLSSASLLYMSFLIYPITFSSTVSNDSKPTPHPRASRWLSV